MTMKRASFLLILTLSVFLFIACCYRINEGRASTASETRARKGYVTQHDGRLWLNGDAYHFVGANLWYGAILGSKGQGGDQKRLCHELDALHKMGINNLRISVGSDGTGLEPYPTTHLWATHLKNHRDSIPFSTPTSPPVSSCKRQQARSINQSDFFKFKIIRRRKNNWPSHSQHKFSYRKG